MSAEALMRSRYAAYALGLADYIIQTTHPKNPDFCSDVDRWRQEILVFHQTTVFENLKILHTQEGADTSTVTFTAYLSSNGKDISFTEESRFQKELGRWLYLRGKRLPLP